MSEKWGKMRRTLLASTVLLMVVAVFSLTAARAEGPDISGRLEGGYRDREILIYCAIVNRSTVAAKILLDNGFKQIANLRHGIVDWHRRQLPVVP